MLVGPVRDMKEGSSLMNSARAPLVDDENAEICAGRASTSSGKSTTVGGTSVPPTPASADLTWRLPRSRTYYVALGYPDSC